MMYIFHTPYNLHTIYVSHYFYLSYFLCCDLLQLSSIECSYDLNENGYSSVKVSILMASFAIWFHSYD